MDACMGVFLYNFIIGTYKVCTRSRTKNTFDYWFSMQSTCIYAYICIDKSYCNMAFVPYIPYIGIQPCVVLCVIHSSGEVEVMN